MTRPARLVVFYAGAVAWLIIIVLAMFEGEGAGRAIIAAVLAGVLVVPLAVSCFAAAEAIILAIDVEHNSRRTADAIDRLATAMLDDRR